MIFDWQFLRRREGAAVRLMKTAECGAAAILHSRNFARGWSEEELSALVLDPQVEAHVLARGHRVDGFVLSRLAADEAEILTIVLDEAQRGQGLATKLLLNHIARLVTRGIKVLFLEVGQTNQAALSLYFRHGFFEVGRRPAYYKNQDGSHSEAIILKKDLV